jgi:hypothetical protein
VSAALFFNERKLANWVELGARPETNILTLLHPVLFMYQPRSRLFLPTQQPFGLCVERFLQLLSDYMDQAMAASFLLLLLR